MQRNLGYQIFLEDIRVYLIPEKFNKEYRLMKKGIINFKFLKCIFITFFTNVMAMADINENLCLHKK